MKNLILICSFILLSSTVALAQGNGFSFQGRLNDGINPANGRYDLQFRLFDSLVAGNPIGSLLSRPNTTLINGVFSVTLDFGATAFNNPNNVFIEIGLRPNGSPNAFTILGPRQQLTVVPLAVRAANATNADNATNAVNAINATTATTSATAAVANNAVLFAGSPASQFARLNSDANNGGLDIHGQIVSSGDLTVAGHAFQGPGSFGIAKAMLEVIHTAQGMQVRCYNGVGNASGSTCGFVVTMPLEGVVRINFGFPIANRFVSVSAQYTSSAGNNNTGVNYRSFDSTSIEVFTFASTSEDTIRRDFALILY
ncbi:MAG: hypothetical protein ABIP75_03480 [Pyrinomonadaceae bacterium]